MTKKNFISEGFKGEEAIASKNTTFYRKDE